MRLFFLVLARDERHVDEKIEELNDLGVPYLIVCGKRINHPKVIHRKPRGKYDAINFGFHFVPENTDIVALNDVDTKIRNFQAILRLFSSKDVALVFAKVYVKEGPQKMFLAILRHLRRGLPMAASGDLMLMKYEVLKRVLPIKPCKAEDSYLLFKVLELKYKVADCEDCYVVTEKTRTAKEDEDYKRRTVGGIYQALSMTRPPIIVRLFYTLLPFISLLLLILGKNGYYWTRGILLGYVDYSRGDRTAYWKSTYS